MSTPISVRLSDAVRAEVDRRHDTTHGGDRRSTGRSSRPHRSTVIERDLARYYALLVAQRESVWGRFAPQEQRALMDALGNTAWEPWSIPHLALNVEEALRDGLAARFGINGEDLLHQVRVLDPLACLALVDAVEQAMVRADAL